MKRRETLIRATILVLLSAVLLCFVAPESFRFPVIGRVYGAENQFIEIDGVAYERTTSDPYNSGDRAHYIGSVKNAAITMRIYEYRGEDDRKYLHALWDWEGYTYVRQSE